MDKKEKDKLSKEELITIGIFALSVILLLTVYILIIIIYGQKPAEDVPYWIRLLLN